MLDFLDKQSDIEELYLSPIPVETYDILTSIGNLSKLRTLHLGYNDQTDYEYTALMGLTQLKELHLEVSYIKLKF